jgi:hypothetical protein
MLSFAALAFLGWYVRCRVPRVPGWYLWTWIFFSPWTLDFSTQIVNPSYVAAGAILFVVGALELVPALRIGVVRRSVAGFCMGFGLLWVYQLHLSASLLVPLAAVVFLLAGRADVRATLVAFVWFVIGASLAGATLVPTLLAFGVGGVARSTGANVVFEPSNLLQLPVVAAQFLSFATFEVPRFIGANSHDRLLFLVRYWWAAPFVVFATLCGVLQAGVLLFGLVGRRDEKGAERAVRLTTIGILALVYASFVFSVKAPASHAFYVTMPLVVIYAFYVWDRILVVRSVRLAAAALVVAGAITHLAIAVKSFHDTSLYTRRADVVRAIDEKNYHWVGERRSDLWDLEDRGIPARP